MSLNSGLVSYWKLDEASGTRSDSAGPNHLSPVNGPAAASGVLGNCLQVADGDESAVAKDGRIATAPTISLSLWVKNAFGRNVYWKVLAQRDIDGEDEIKFQFSDEWCVFGGLRGWFEYRTLPSANEWAHFVLTSDATGAKMYLNGTLVASKDDGPVHGFTSADPGQFIVGCYKHHSGDFGTGYVDEVGVWDRVLTAQEASDLYNGGAGVAYPF